MRRAVGSVRQVAPREWMVQVSAGRDVAGARRRLTRRVRGSRTDAERVLARLVIEARGAGAAPTKLTVETYLLEHWLPARRPGLRSRTAEGYEGVVRRYISGAAIADVPLGKLTPLDVERWLAGLRATGRISERTILSAFRVLRAGMRQAVRWRLVERDPTDAVAAPVPKRYQAARVSTQDAAAIIGAFREHPLEAAVALALGGGLRRSEVLGLSWDDVDLDAGELAVRRTLQVPRGGLEMCEPKSDRSRRRVALPEWVLEALRAHRLRQVQARLAAGGRWREGGHVFTTSIGTPYAPDRLSVEFRARQLEAELAPVRFHDLRHAHATLGLAVRPNLTAMSRRLGHSTIAITADVYTDVPPEVDRDVARAFDELLGEASR